jgi:hypothetical protein
MKAMKLVPVVSLLVPALARATPATGYADDTLLAQQGSCDCGSARCSVPLLEGSWDHDLAPIDGALEIGIATGYAQGGGKLGGDMGSLEDVAGPGASVQLELAYRILPRLSVGAYGTLAAYQHGDRTDSDTDVLGATAGLQAAWHFRPDRSIDPWVSVGAGWIGLWVEPSIGKTTSLQGLELARLQVGADYRLSENVAIAPVIGGSLSMFLGQDSAMTTEFTEIDDKQVNVTAFAGLAGRFDLRGSR